MTSTFTIRAQRCDPAGTGSAGCHGQRSSKFSGHDATPSRWMYGTVSRSGMWRRSVTLIWYWVRTASTARSENTTRPRSGQRSTGGRIGSCGWAPHDRSTRSHSSFATMSTAYGECTRTNTSRIIRRSSSRRGKMRGAQRAWTPRPKTRRWRSASISLSMNWTDTASRRTSRSGDNSQH